MHSEWSEIVFNHRDPVYMQVVRHFKELIVTGRLAAGQTIPSRRELAVLVKINPNTAQRAFREMEEQKLIVTEGNTPSRVTSDEKVLQLIRSELLNDAIDEFVQSIRAISISPLELLELVRQRMILSEGEKAEQGGGEG